MISSTAAEFFGERASVFLFGSRLDDTRRGGDIDLFVTVPEFSLQRKLDAKLRFLVAIKRKLGDRRIDVVFAPGDGEEVLPIHRIAKETGVRL